MSVATAAVPVIGSLVRRHRLLPWLAVAVMLTGALLAIIIAGQAEPDQRSVWEAAFPPARVFLFVVGIILTPAVLPTYLGHGVTRRTVTLAVSAATGALVGFIAILSTAGLLLERAVFDALDRPYQLHRQHLFTEVGQVPLVFTEFLLVGAASLISGWLIGGSFYRFGWRLAIPTLPLALLPVMAMERLAGDALPTHPSLPVPVLIALGLLVLALGSAAVYALHRSIPLRTGGD